MCLLELIICNRTRGVLSIRLRQSKKVEMKNNFYHLSDIPFFDKQMFECELGESLGLTRNCYICENYIHQSVRLPECDKNCSCKEIYTRKELLTHWCHKLFESIGLQIGEQKNIFVINMGLESNGEKHDLVADYLIPIYPVAEFSLQPVNIESFLTHFRYQEDF